MAVILLIEDEQDNRDLVRLTVEMGGHEVVEAVTGEAGVELAASVRPALVLMDLNLPGAIDGLEATRRLRADPAFDDTPVIALTALVSRADRVASVDAGCDAYVSKPIADLEEFLALVERFIAEGRAAGTARERDGGAPP